jgi:hypothetical protein
MKILVVDGQGGGLGKAIIEGILKAGIAAEITAVGTNAIATAAMLKGGAAQGATGENAVIYNSKRVDFIVGTLGIAFANSMQGEITPKMASAIGESEAKKLLVPSSKCGADIIGTVDRPMASYIDEIVSKLG